MKAEPSGASDVITRLQSRGFAPELRPDVELVRLPDRSLVRLSCDRGASWIDLSPLDSLIAQQMDGERSLDSLVDFARQYDRGVDRVRVERLVLELHARGLVLASDPPPSPHDREDNVVPLPTRRAPGDELAAMSAELADTFAERDGGRMDASDTRVESEPGEPEPDGESQQETPEGVEAEQEAVWQEVRAVKWHQRTWVRLLLALGVFVAAAAVIPYPLKVTSDAVIIPTQRAYVRSKTAGIIADILVDEAAPVRKGDILARLDDRALTTDRRKAQGEIGRIEADIKRLRRGARAEEIAAQRAVVAGAANEVAFARREAQRKARMAQQGVGSVQARDQARHELAVKEKALAEASASLRLLMAGSRPEEIAAREAELDQARAQLGFVEEQLELTVIRAPIDGVLLTPRFRDHLNEKIEAGGLLCQIAKTDRMRAEIYLSEADVDSVAVGQQVVVKVQSYPTREFAGKVDFLAPIVEKQGDQNRVRVVAELDNADKLLKQDMTGYGEINCGRRSVLNLMTRRMLHWVRVRFLL